MMLPVATVSIWSRARVHRCARRLTFDVTASPTEVSFRLRQRRPGAGQKRSQDDGCYSEALSRWR